VISALALVLFGLLQADGMANAVSVDRGESGSPALVVVALPANANRAIVEALNRLRGEATSVGFEVRFVDASTESMNLARLDGLARGLRSAAVVAFADPEGGAPKAQAFDVWFLDRASGKTSVAHLTAGEVVDDSDRSEVVLAVRAVDFIRARMFDTLAGRQAEPVFSPPRPELVRVQRGYVAGGVVVLGGASGFSPMVSPQVEVGYRLAEWSRLGVTASGFGTQPSNDGTRGRVSLAPRSVSANLMVWGRAWRRLQPALSTGVGQFWLRVRGDPSPPNEGRTVVLSSLCADLAAGIMVRVLPNLLVDLRGGSLWLRSELKINSTSDTYLGSVGRPAWFGVARLGLSF